MKEVTLPPHNYPITAVHPEKRPCSGRSINLEDKKYERAKANNLVQCPTCGVSIRVNLA